jgi:hypothetical protein
MNNINRDSYVRFRLNAGERKTLEILAEMLGVNLSETMRLALREAAITRGVYSFGTIPIPALGGGSEDANTDESTS